MDFLFKFNVLNTAMTAIGKEISDKIRRIGSSWHFCLFIWTLYFGIAEIRKDFFNLGPASAMLFIGASLYLVFTDYTEKIFRIDILKQASKVCLYVSMPFVVVHYVWKPLNRGVRCMLNRIVGQCDDSWSVTVSTVLAVFFTALFYIHQRRVEPSEEATKSSNTSVKRRTSARILARKQSASAKLRQ